MLSNDYLSFFATILSSGIIFGFDLFFIFSGFSFFGCWMCDFSFNFLSIGSLSYSITNPSFPHLVSSSRKIIRTYDMRGREGSRVYQTSFSPARIFTENTPCSYVAKIKPFRLPKIRIQANFLKKLSIKFGSGKFYKQLYGSVCTHIYILVV